MASGFLAPKVDAQEATTPTTEATATVRGVAGLMAIVGAVCCFIAPIASLGVVMLVIGGLVWLLAPANEPATAQMVAESAEGGGCAAGLIASLGALVIMALALVAALAVVFGGGL